MADNMKKGNLISSLKFLPLMLINHEPDEFAPFSSNCDFELILKANEGNRLESMEMSASKMPL